ncbi:tripartite tricarboxylate transporter permease [Natrialba swarupiae]|uniref:Tripartite tricarboxylate transporter permease n=1 Tax=Natrialba swarupiae TaxID=2448032 RepID=A0A5D5ALH4_9EURY|nr:tripartite tricarboxylate transporter permease [Natrialba swarupiae]TYT62556.1 tripartite tricarboxylate transporter permease [Natrialba swarupiae]
MIDSLFHAIDLVFSWPAILWLAVGMLFGIFVGALPGVGPNLGMAVVLPLTVPLDGITAIILLISIYSGAMYGGSIAAILINTPGNAAAAATTFDGYPMTRLGQARKALAVSATASALGGMLTIVTIILLSPLLIEFVLMFGSPEYFLIAMFGLVLITVVTRGSMVKGITAGAFGLLLTSVGIPVMTFEQRYTFGILELQDGISFVVALIGVFAIGEMMRLAAEQGGIVKEDVELSGSIASGFWEVIKNPISTIRSAFIGLGIGAVPGSGASVSNFISYGEAVRSDSDDTYGEGNPKGVIASEAANNGTVAGSLIPTLSFGIPGSGATAILLGGLLMHGIRPSPELFGAELHITYATFIALIVGNVFIFLFGLLIVTRTGHWFTRINTDYIIPLVICLAVTGSFAIRNNWLDLAFVVAFGVLGYYMVKHNYSIIAFVLGIVLGPIAEENLYRTIELGGFPVFLERPLSILLLALTVLVLVGPLIKNQLEARRNAA